MRALIKQCLVIALFLNSVYSAPIYGSSWDRNADDISYKYQNSDDDIDEHEKIYQRRQHPPAKRRSSFLNKAWTACLWLLAGSSAVCLPQATSGQVVAGQPAFLPSTRLPYALAHPLQRFKGRRLMAAGAAADHDSIADEDMQPLGGEEVDGGTAESGNCLLLTMPPLTNSDDDIDDSSLKGLSALADDLIASPALRSKAELDAEPLSIQTLDLGVQWKMFRRGVPTDEPVRLSYTFSDLMETIYNRRYPNIRPLDEETRQLVRDALAHISAQSSLTFYESDDANSAQANLHFRRADRDNSLVAGYAYLPRVGNRRTVATLLLSPDKLSESPVTIHEILHMLGFGHPHDGKIRLPQGGWSDNIWSTVMSYIHHRCRGATETGPLDNFLLATYHPKSGEGRPRELGSSDAPFCLYHYEKMLIIAGSVVVGGSLIVVIGIVIYKKRSKASPPSTLAAGDTGATEAEEDPIPATNSGQVVQALQDAPAPAPLESDVRQSLPSTAKSATDAGTVQSTGESQDELQKRDDELYDVVIDAA